MKFRRIIIAASASCVALSAQAQDVSGGAVDRFDPCLQ